MGEINTVTKMTLDQLKQSLRNLVDGDVDDVENNHIQADYMLLEYINNYEVRHLFDCIQKYYKLEEN